MNSITRIIALAFFVALAMSATTGTFNSVTSFAASSTSARVYTQGFLVTLTAAGWAYGDAISLTTASATSVTYTTLVSHTGQTGIGLAVVGATTGCTTAPTVTSTGYTTASLLGNGAATCPSDFVTLYTATPTGTTTNTNFAFATIPLVDTTPFKWTITNPASVVAANCNGVTVQPVGGTAVTVASAACNTAAPGVVSQAVSTSSFAFYVQTATAASVCFQTETQYAASAGNCGTLVVVTSSAGILSATISGFVAMVALIFFN